MKDQCDWRGNLKPPFLFDGYKAGKDAPDLYAKLNTTINIRIDTINGPFKKPMICKECFMELLPE